MVVEDDKRMEYWLESLKKKSPLGDLCRDEVINLKGMLSEEYI